MKKCDVVCANCHRRRTAKRGGFLRSVVANQAAPSKYFVADIPGTQTAFRL
jgi:hypothetical protein